MGEGCETVSGLTTPCPHLSFLCLLHLLPHPPCSQVSHLPPVSENDPHLHISLAPRKLSLPLRLKSLFQASVRGLLRCCQHLFSKKFLRAEALCFHLRSPHYQLQEGLVGWGQGALMMTNTPSPIASPPKSHHTELRVPTGGTECGEGRRGDCPPDVGNLTHSPSHRLLPLPAPFPLNIY